MGISAAVPSMNELILSFHSGEPYMMWITFNDSHGEQPCAECAIPHRTLVMTSPATGMCDSCWERGTKSRIKVLSQPTHK